MSLFVEYGKDSRYLIRILAMVICVEAAVIVLLGMAVVKGNIIYINPDNVIGTAKRGYVPDDYAAYFGMMFIHFRGNSSPATVKEQYRSAFALMSARLQSQEADILKKEANEIIGSNISLQTIPTGYAVRSSNEGFSIDIEAMRISYAYGQEASRKIVKYLISCNKTRTTKSNPFGLEVSSYDYKVIEDKTDNSAVGGTGAH